MGSSNGTHAVVGEHVAEGVRTARFYEPDGSSYDGEVKITDPGYQPRASDPVLVPCPGSGAANVFHQPEGGGQRRGPAMANTPAFCAGYDRIFRKSKSATSPSPEEVN